MKAMRNSFMRRTLIGIPALTLASAFNVYAQTPVVPATNPARNDSQSATPQPAPAPPRVCAEGELKARTPIYAHCNVKLGLPKDEAAEALTETQRKFLDGVLRIYNEAGLLAKREEAIAAIGAEIESTRKSSTVWPSGRRTFGRIDSLKSTGLFTRFEYWQSSYRNSPRDPAAVDEYGRRWVASLEVQIDRKRECLPSRAVEGYLDIPLSSRIFGTIPPRLRANWDRHEFGGTAAASPSGPLGPVLEVDFLHKCLSAIRFDAMYRSKEMSDDHLYD